MKRLGVLGLAGLLLAFCLNIPAWAYTIELTYFPDSNLVDPYARKTSWDADNNFPIEAEDIPGQLTAQGTVSRSALVTAGEPPKAIATGGATVQQAVVLKDRIDSTQSIIHAYALAGPTTGVYYEGWGTGYGNTYFSFLIVPEPGEAAQVPVILGFRVNGWVEKAGALSLEFGGKLKYFNEGEDLQFAYEKKTSWQGSNPISYANGGEVTLLLNTNTPYLFEGFLQVDAQAYGYNFPSENQINFDAFVDIQVVPVPPAVLLLGSGLALLGLSSLHRRR